MIDAELLAILACPACQGDVRLCSLPIRQAGAEAERKNNSAKADVALKEEKIVCLQCGRQYPIRDGVPIMLVDEAQGPRRNS